MKNFLNKALVPAFFLMALCPLVFQKNAIQSIIMIAACLVLLAAVPFKDLKLNKKALPFIMCFFILTFYFLFYFSSKSFKFIGESFLLFIFPLLSIYAYRFTSFKKNLPNVMLTYCGAIGILCIYFLALYIRDIPHHQFSWFHARYFLELYTEIHGTYICLWIAVAIIFLVNYILTGGPHSRLSKIIFILLFLLYAGGLIIFNSRNIMLGLFIIAIINLIRFKKRIPNSIKFGFVAVFVGLLFLSQRYIDDIKFMFSHSITNSTRYIISSCTFNAIHESDFMGMDYSLIQQKLNECYATSDNPEFKASELNTHNQYLDYFLKGGILMFIAFIASFFIKIKYSLKQKNYLYFSITLLFMISLLTENVLIRQYGIYIYSFCDVLLLGAIVSNQAYADSKIIESQGR